MILGFHYHIPAYEKNGVIYTSGFLGLFLDSLADQVDELVCFQHTPLPSEVFLMDFTLKSKNIRLVTMGAHVSVPRRLLNSSQIMSKIQAELHRVDVLLIRSPTPLMPALSGIKFVKKAFLIVGDYQKSARDLHQPYIRKKAIQLWAFINKWQQRRAIRHALVFVNNGLIYEELKSVVKNLHLVKTTTLQESDFFFRENTCHGKTINLLYTGRIDLSKGLMEMLEALSKIRQHGIDARLHLVGWEDKNSMEVTNLLRKRSESLFLTDYVSFHGKKQVGDELNVFYRMADIYIIGSKVNEGFPRTIWEAFANSLPVIASAVGSIPLFLQNNLDVLLIKPGSVDELVDALLRLINEKGLRNTLIKNAYQLAKANTLKAQAAILTRIIGDYAKT